MMPTAVRRLCGQLPVAPSGVATSRGAHERAHLAAAGKDHALSAPVATTRRRFPVGRHAVSTGSIRIRIVDCALAGQFAPVAERAGDALDMSAHGLLRRRRRRARAIAVIIVKCSAAELIRASGQAELARASSGPSRRRKI